MNIPVIFILFLIFIFIFRHNLNKTDKETVRLNKLFWNKEEKSLFARKQKINDDIFILSTLPTNIRRSKVEYKSLGDSSIYKLQERCFYLSKEPMANLSNLSNSEVRLKYGASNLDNIDIYESNYTLYIKSLYEFGKKLYDLGLTETSIIVLEEAINAKTDISGNYILLAKIYHTSNNTSKLNDLYNKATKLNSLTKNKVIREIDQLNH
jgi:hypothetical protein